jgi:hypothetical protein
MLNWLPLYTVQQCLAKIDTNYRALCGEEPLIVLNLNVASSISFLTAAHKIYRNAQFFSETRWEMQLVIVGDPIGNAKCVLKTIWEMPREFIRVFKPYPGKCPNNTEHLFPACLYIYTS